MAERVEVTAKEFSIVDVGVKSSYKIRNVGVLREIHTFDGIHQKLTYDSPLRTPQQKHIRIITDIR